MAKRRTKRKAKKATKRRKIKTQNQEPLPVRYSQDELEHHKRQAVERALHRDRVAGFLAGVASLSPPRPGMTSNVTLGYDTVVAVAKELRASGF